MFQCRFQKAKPQLWCSEKISIETTGMSNIFGLYFLILYQKRVLVVPPAIANNLYDSPHDIFCTLPAAKRCTTHTWVCSIVVCIICPLLEKTFNLHFILLCNNKSASAVSTSAHLSIMCYFIDTEGEDSAVYLNNILLWPITEFICLTLLWKSAAPNQFVADLRSLLSADSNLPMRHVIQFSVNFNILFNSLLLCKTTE